LIESVLQVLQSTNQN